MEKLEIRNVREEDLERCFEIETVCYEGHGASRQRIERRIHEYPTGFLVGETNGVTLGFVNSGCFLRDDISKEKLKDLDGHDPKGANLVIFSVAVHPDFQRNGYGGQLMTAFVSHAREIGKRSILLVCRAHHLGFYESFGFSYRAPSAFTFGGYEWLEMSLLLNSPLTFS